MSEYVPAIALIAVTLLPFVLIWLAVRRRRRAPDTVCTQCGTVGRAASATRGSMSMEILLWLCFVVPGLIYSMWRLTTRHKACRQCGATQIVPVTSPVGRKLVAEMQAQQ